MGLQYLLRQILPKLIHYVLSKFDVQPAYLTLMNAPGALARIFAFIGCRVKHAPIKASASVERISQAGLKFMCHKTSDVQFDPQWADFHIRPHYPVLQMVFLKVTLAFQMV